MFPQCLVENLVCKLIRFLQNVSEKSEKIKDQVFPRRDFLWDFAPQNPKLYWLDPFFIFKFFSYSQRNPTNICISFIWFKEIFCGTFIFFRFYLTVFIIFLPCFLVAFKNNIQNCWNGERFWFLVTYKHILDYRIWKPMCIFVKKKMDARETNKVEKIIVKEKTTMGYKWCELDSPMEGARSTLLFFKLLWYWYEVSATLNSD